MTPTLAVIMPTYNAEKYLKKAIESILRQTFTDFELIIVDDNSTDGSLNIVKSYFYEERIKLIVNKARTGLVRSLNIGLSKARGEYLARHDADDISVSNRFEEQVKFLSKHPEVGLVGTGIFIINEKSEIIGQDIYPENPKRALMERNVLCHGSVMFRKAAIDKVGMYNKSFKYSEDYELWLRIAKHYDIRNITRPLYAWRYHENSRYGFATQLFKGEFAFNKLAKKLASGELDIEETVH